MLLSFCDVGVNAFDESVDDFWPLGMVVRHLFDEIAAKPQQACADVTVDRLVPLDFGHSARHPSPPDFELKEPVAGGVVALGKEQIVLVLGVNVRDTPAIHQDLDRTRESRNLERRSGPVCEERRGRKYQTQETRSEKYAAWRPQTLSHKVIRVDRVQ